MRTDFDLESLKELLPFYVNGTLEAGDRAELEAALPVSAELRDALEEEHAMQTLFNSAMEDEMAKVEDAKTHKAQGLMGDGSGNASADNGAGDNAGLAKALSFLNPTNWAPAVTLAIAAAAVGQTAALAAQSGTIDEQNARIAQLEADNFALASGQKDCESKAVVILELSDSADWGAVNALLEGENLTIESGNAQGVLMLEHSGEADALEAVIERLNASDLVASASKAA